MGRGSYVASDWIKLKISKGINEASNTYDIFKTRAALEKYLPKFINLRESRDSVDSPLSTPIILGFDVTGSMGYLASEIAKNSLNKTITQICEKRPVTDPHLMCAAFVSPNNKEGLQVTQFEADIRIVEQLLDLKVGFGGNKYSYDSLVWYFADKYTDIDCFNKRGKKGYIFCIGDEICGEAQGDTISTYDIRDLFGECDNRYSSIPMKKIYAKASKRYEIFHIVTGTRLNNSYNSWKKFIPGRVAKLRNDDISLLCEVIISILQIYNGMKKDKVIAQWDDEVSDIIADAIADIKPYTPSIFSRFSR